MTTARCLQVLPDITPYYQCTSRCVRRAHLCGFDHLTQKSFDHRKDWIERRIQDLGQTFAIDVASYAIMSNHFHVVLHINMAKGKRFPDTEVIERWGRFFRIPKFVSDFSAGQATSAERQKYRKTIAKWRKRLMDLSWFMRLIKEPLARLANAEDNCTGRFWEGRYKTQALLDDKALLTCMTYVDLNPIRAGLAYTPEDSDHTSIKARIGNNTTLMKFQDEADPGSKSASQHQFIPITKRGYFELVDWSGRACRIDKRGAIPADAPPIIWRLSSPQQWQAEVQHFGSWYGPLAGRLAKIKEVYGRLGKRWMSSLGPREQPA